MSNRKWPASIVSFALGVLVTWLMMSLLSGGRTEAGGSGAVMDMTTANQVSPKEYLVFDFGAKTATFLEVNTTGPSAGHVGIISVTHYADSSAKSGSHPAP